MNDIKTREKSTGTVKTIDRAALLSRSMKRTSIKAKDQISGLGSDDGSNESAYAEEKMFGMTEYGAGYGKDAAFSGFKGLTQIGQFRDRSKEEEALRETTEHIMAEKGPDVIIIDPEKEHAKVMENYAKYANHTPKKYKSGKKASSVAEKGENTLKRQYRTRRAREAFGKNAEKSGKKILASLKRAVQNEKVIVAALAIAGSIALVSIIVCTFFGSAFYILGDEDSGYILGDFEGIGDAGIVEVAASQIGNIGGEPYWSWYGFNGRVEWCACFVSWCANQCGYIEAEIIPKFAVVGTGIDWFKERHQWQKRGYQPKPGDIIFFDWEGNGYGSHVGIVESSDDTYVYTIEGNSSDMCRRRTYFLHSSVIMGYGVPAYSLHIDGIAADNP